MRLEDATHEMFARHETFHLRHGWLRKGYFGVLKHGSEVFSQDTATVDLGVGKNMVRSIRFWGLATKVLAEQTSPDNPRATTIGTTKFGKELFEWWDPFLEDPASHWLLHWQMFSPKSHLPVWWTLLSEFSALEFTEDEAVEFVVRRIESSTYGSPNPSSIKKDVNIFMRSYAPAGERQARGVVDDSFDCQLRELGLLRRGSTPKSFRMNVGPKSSLPPAIVAYACLDHLVSVGNGSTTSSIARFIADTSGPGQVFKLHESALHEALSAAVSENPEISVSITNGAPQLICKGDPKEAGKKILDRYYEVPSDQIARLKYKSEPLLVGAN
jgi:hypothetical protein